MAALRTAAVAMCLATQAVGTANSHTQGHVLIDAILANAVNGEKNRACICDGTFSRTVDYFPHKMIKKTAKGFTVSYHGFYKIINNTAVTPPVVHVGYQCGAPKPTVQELGFNATAFIELPVSRVGVMSTTDIPWIEYVGDREAIKAGPRRADVSSSCLQLLMDSGGSQAAITPAFVTNKSVLDAAKVEVTFCSAGWGCNGLDAAPSATPAPVGANKETGVLAKAAWVEYIAAYLNREQAAKDVVAQVASMFACHKARAASAVGSGAKPKVLWARWSDFPGWEMWDVAKCPNYYCELVDAAGGELILFPTAPGKNDTTFFSLAQQADVWFYTGTNWDKLVAGPTNISTLLQQVPAVANKRVFDIQKNGQYDWFESSQAEPDVVLEDLIAAIHPSAAGGHQRVWWRNVSTGGEPVGSTTASTCTDTTLPLQLKADACGSTTKPQAPRNRNRATTATCVLGQSAATSKVTGDVEFQATDCTACRAFEGSAKFGAQLCKSVVSWMQLGTAFEKSCSVAVKCAACRRRLAEDRRLATTAKAGYTVTGLTKSQATAAKSSVTAASVTAVASALATAKAADPNTANLNIAGVKAPTAAVTDTAVEASLSLVPLPAATLMGIAMAVALLPASL